MPFPDAFPLAVLTTGRQDWSLLRPLVDRLLEAGGWDVQILAGGMACSVKHGRIVDRIVATGYPVARMLAWDVETASAMAQSSEALNAIGSALVELGSKALVLLGDRFETAAAALAATLLRMPIVHIHGGEETEGAIDNALRHAITKMSHLHFVAHEVYARRVIQMGEDPATVHVVGSLGVDNLLRLETPSKTELERLLGIRLVPPIGLVTVHPTTLPGEGEDRVAQSVAEAIKRIGIGTWVVTLPNCDPGHEQVREIMLGLGRRKPNVIAVEALGEEAYLGLMKIASCVLGNSSSGMTEAPALGVPTVNVGDRQKGRLRFPSIVDVEPRAEKVTSAIRKALSGEFRARAASARRELGDGHAAERIVRALARNDFTLPRRKRFRDLDWLADSS